MLPKRNITSPNPAFIINTGVLKNVINSFFINEVYTDLDWITTSPDLTLLVVLTLFNLELILK